VIPILFVWDGKDIARDALAAVRTEIINTTRGLVKSMRTRPQGIREKRISSGAGTLLGSLEIAGFASSADSADRQPVLIN
jgi:hypothetical protein